MWGANYQAILLVQAGSEGTQCCVPPMKHRQHSAAARAARSVGGAGGGIMGAGQRDSKQCKLLSSKSVHVCVCTCMLRTIEGILHVCIHQLQVWRGLLGSVARLGKRWTQRHVQLQPYLCAIAACAQGRQQKR